MLLFILFYLSESLTCYRRLSQIGFSIELNNFDTDFNSFETILHVNINYKLYIILIYYRDEAKYLILDL